MTDAFASHRVLHGSGILAQWNAAGVLSAGDVHVVRRLVAMCAEPVDEIAALGAALAVRAVRLGSTCLAIERVSEMVAGAWEHDQPAPQSDPAEVPSIVAELPTTQQFVDALAASPLVAGSAAGPLRPLVLRDSDDGPLLYLHKYFRQEQTIRSVLEARSSTPPSVQADAVRDAVAAAFELGESARRPQGDDTEGNPEQRLAAYTAASRWLTVLAGGPGTGKTFTVARILTALNNLAGRELRIGLCAPTGRAAAQLQASVADDPAAPRSVQAVTVHSLLAWRPGSAPRYHRANTLPHDVIVVDETSMLSMTAMSHLLDAVRRDARVILVGDPHQLASVDAGAVLADLVDRVGAATTGQVADLGSSPALDVLLAELGDVIDEPTRLRARAGVVTLRRGYRNSVDIAALAERVNVGDSAGVGEMLLSGELADVELVDPTDTGAVREDVMRWGSALASSATLGDAESALKALGAHRVLCAHREGSWGVQGWSGTIMEWLRTTGPVGADPHALWTAGRPVLITANDRQTSTFNGDCGVVITDAMQEADTGEDLVDEWADQDRAECVAVFPRGREVLRIHPARLADVVPAYAMTIHRSQGSQFDTVTVVLPPAGSELLTRELLYTAITRARTHVRIVGTLDVLKAAVDRQVARASGLRSQTRAHTPGVSR